MQRRQVLKSAVAALGTGAWAAGAAAETAAGTLSLIGPFAAGGSNDGIARIYGVKMAAVLGRSVIVDNRPGAGGLIAAQYVARSAPDGATLLITSNTFLIAPYAYRNAGYQAMRDFVPITPLYSTGVAWVTRPDYPARNLSELVAMAKRSPGKITVATNGVGTLAHLQMEMFKQRHGIDLTHVPYKSLPEGTAAVMGGYVDVSVDTPFSVAARVRAGLLRGLVIFGTEREAVLPDVPTNTESGFPDPDQQLVFAGIAAPARTPPAILAQLKSASAQVVRDAEYMRQVERNGARPMAMSDGEFTALMKRYDAQYKDLVGKLGVSLT